MYKKLKLYIDTSKGVHVVNLREGYSLIEIVSPREFVSK